MNNCRLCSERLRNNSNEFWNAPLFEFPNFIVLPSLGAIVEGWLLLVPKEHFICMGALPESLMIEMQEIKHYLCSSLQRMYGPVCTFEHGPSRPNLSIGCGVDHAHLHIVPLSFDLASAVAPLLPEGIFWTEGSLADYRSAFRRGEDYLYLEQPIGTGRILTYTDLGSQLFRRAIAAKSGVPSQFNWRDYPHIPTVAATVDKIRAWDGDMPLRISQSMAAV